MEELHPENLYYFLGIIKQANIKFFSTKIWTHSYLIYQYYGCWLQLLYLNLGFIINSFNSSFSVSTLPLQYYIHLNLYNFLVKVRHHQQLYVYISVYFVWRLPIAAFVAKSIYIIDINIAVLLNIVVVFIAIFISATVAAFGIGVKFAFN